MTKVKPIPDGYRSVTPYLFIKGAAEAIEYYKDIFGAKEIMRMPGPEGKIAHAELQIGDSLIMLADEAPQIGAKSPATLNATTGCLHVYVEDVDGVVKKAVGANAKLVQQVKDQFYGDRTGTITDPYGHMWSLATHFEDVTPEQMKERLAKMNHAAAG
jgi:PhnB protein